MNESTLSADAKIFYPTQFQTLTTNQVELCEGTTTNNDYFGYNQVPGNNLRWTYVPRAPPQPPFYQQPPGYFRFPPPRPPPIFPLSPFQSCALRLPQHPGQLFNGQSQSRGSRPQKQNNSMTQRKKPVVPTNMSASSQKKLADQPCGDGGPSSPLPPEEEDTDKRPKSSKKKKKNWKKRPANVVQENVDQEIRNTRKLPYTEVVNIEDVEQFTSLSSAVQEKDHQPGVTKVNSEIETKLPISSSTINSDAPTKPANRNGIIPWPANLSDTKTHRATTDKYSSRLGAQAFSLEDFPPVSLRTESKCDTKVAPPAVLSDEKPAVISYSAKVSMPAMVRLKVVQVGASGLKSDLQRSCDELSDKTVFSRTNKNFTKKQIFLDRRKPSKYENTSVDESSKRMRPLIGSGRFHYSSDVESSKPTQFGKRSGKAGGANSDVESSKPMRSEKGSGRFETISDVEFSKPTLFGKRSGKAGGANSDVESSKPMRSEKGSGRFETSSDVEFSRPMRSDRRPRKFESISDVESSTISYASMLQKPKPISTFPVQSMTASQPPPIADSQPSKSKGKTRRKKKKKPKTVHIDLEEAHRMLQGEQVNIASYPTEFEMNTEEFPDLGGAHVSRLIPPAAASVLPIATKSVSRATVKKKVDTYDWFTLQFDSERVSERTEASPIQTEEFKAEDPPAAAVAVKQQKAPSGDVIQKPANKQPPAVSHPRGKVKQIPLLTMGLVTDALQYTGAHKPAEGEPQEGRKSTNKRQPGGGGTDASKSGANPLDSKAPQTRRGKERVNPRRKKPSVLRKAIMADREERRRLRLLEAERRGLAGEQTEKPLQVANDLVDSLNNADALTATDGEIGATTADDVTDDSESEVSQSETEMGPPAVDDQCSVADRLSSSANEALRAIKEDSAKTKSPQQQLHSRRFRDYCNQMVTSAVNECVTEVLSELARFQDRAYKRDPIKAKLKRRMVYGFREVCKFLRLRRICLVILSPDIDKSIVQGGLDDAVRSTLSLCRDNSVPYVFGLARRALGRVCHKPVPVSMVGVLNSDGVEERVGRLLGLVEEGRRQYQEVRLLMDNESMTGASNLGHTRNLSAFSNISEPLSDLGDVSTAGNSNRTLRHLSRENSQPGTPGHSRNPSMLSNASEPPPFSSIDPPPSPSNTTAQLGESGVTSPSDYSDPLEKPVPEATPPLAALENRPLPSSRPPHLITTSGHSRQSSGPSQLVLADVICEVDELPAVTPETTSSSSFPGPEDDVEREL